VPVAFEVSGKAAARVARRDLAAGETLRAEDLEVRRIDAAALAVAPLPLEAEVAARRLARPVLAGEALTDGALAPERAVHRDERIQVRAAVGAVAVETTAVATRDASAGETIRVRGGDGATYLVRVLAPGLAAAPGGAQ
jgi:flagella basal body P-ring formation protein FlgA